MTNYSRDKLGFRFEFGGMKLNSAPDTLAPNKYAMAINVRGYTGQSTRTRPGLGTALLFAAAASTHFPFTDMRAYTALLTDNLPRILARAGDDTIWLDNNTLAGTLVGGGAGLGVAMIPFRPGASPNPYMYIANGFDYQKFSAPNPIVTQQKVGIAEPQTSPDAGISITSRSFTDGGAFWAAAGTAGAAAGGTRLSDTVGQVFVDPASNFVASLQVTSAAQYQRMLPLNIAGVAGQVLVLDVFPGFTNAINILGISYFSGTTGRCIVVPSNFAEPPGGGGESSIYSNNILFGLRRGAIIKIGAEFCLVLSVAVGPDGNIAIETSTTSTHTTADLLTAVPTVLVFTQGITPTNGQAIAALDATYAVTTGIGTQTATLTTIPGSLDPFQDRSSGVPFQPDDYFYIGIRVDTLINLTELKLLFDVGDGTFTQDFYYYTVRPSDIAAAIANSVTQIASAQTLVQRALIDVEAVVSAGNLLASDSGSQLLPGSSVWTQLVFPLSMLTRVGGDLTRSLQNATKMQMLWNASGTINVAVGSFGVVGGYAPDVGDIGAPYRYRVRPRSKVTGAIGNPSPATRYGVSPRREQVIVTLPSAAYDAQIDTWDIERYGGSVTSWRRVGSVPSSSSNFFDTVSDTSAGEGEALEFDNFEPWPSVDVPLSATATSVVGTVALIPIPSPTNVLRYLPGTLVQIGGQNVYTLRARPVLVSGTTYRFEFIESAGVASGVAIYIYEPDLANQMLPYMWGPDASGTIFAVGDPLRLGTVYFAKNNNPDSAPDSYNVEVAPPSEGLLGGEIVDGLSFVASSERWWALFPQPDNLAQRYNFVQQPVARGLAAPYGHCTDGVEIFFWAKDGIYGTRRGSLTDEDLFNLFPHEGVAGQSVTYGGQTVYAPDYSQANKFRLSHANGFLYAVYVSGPPQNGVYQMLVLNLRTMAWVKDVYDLAKVGGISCVYKVEQKPESGNLGGVLNPVLLMAGFSDLGAGTAQAAVYKQTDFTNDRTGPINCILATREFDGGDIRAGEQWGDVFVDVLPIARGVPPVQTAGGLFVTPMGLGVSLFTTQRIPPGTVRIQTPVSLGGQLLSNFLGIFLQWTDDFTLSATPTTLYIWQPSFIPKPEAIADRVTDWDDAGIEGAKWIQGFILHADTANVVKGIAVRDADTLVLHPFTPAVLHNGESELAYSFNTPFIAHQVRLEPTDQLAWRMFGIRWVAEPTPEVAETWQTQATTHGMIGYMHVKQVSITYSSTVPVTLAIGVQAGDGTPPALVTLPSTGGLVQKLVQLLTFNKGQLFTYKFSAAAPFQVYQDKCEVLVGSWGRMEGYVNRPLVGDRGGDEAKI